MRDWKLNLIVAVSTGLVVFGVYRGFGWLPAMIPDLQFGRSSLLETVLGYFIFFAWQFAVIWFSVFIHELGHALFGHMSGFSLYSFQIGQFVWLQQDKKWVVQKLPSFTFGGMYRGFPSSETNLSGRWILMCLGGIFMNLLVSVVVVLVLVFWFGQERLELWNSLQKVLPDGTQLLFRYHPIQADVINNIFGSGLMVLLLSNLSAVFINLVPFKFAQGLSSDGLHILRAIRFEPQFERELGTLLLYGAMHNQVPVKDWKPQWIEMSLKDPNLTTVYVNALYLAYVFAVDNNDIVQAKRYVNDIITIGEKHNWELMHGFALELAWFTAWHDRNSSRAQEFWQIAQQATELPLFVKKRAEAAITFILGDFRTAQEAAQTGLASYKEAGLPYRGAFEARGLEEMLEKIS